MTLSLKDIIDLDYLLGLDEQALETREENRGKAGKREQEDIPARDRNIFKQVKEKNLDERGLLASWLEFRKLLFFDQFGPVLLPGEILRRILGWTGRFLAFLGFVMGLVVVYSFLAYHGTRPINVTLFCAAFVFLPFLLCLGSLVLAVSGRGRSHIHSLVPFLVFKGVLMKKMNALGKGRDSLDHVISLFSRKQRQYGALFFWPLFLLSSLFALGFSLGSLMATLFRVVISDMAFGWQSTLNAGPDLVFSLVEKIALPWSWALPQALPSLAQIEGSRIILKQGIQSLSTESLVSWWPFLCMGILVYAVLPRLVLILAARGAGFRRVARFEFEGPRFRKLLIRMQTPVMDLGPDQGFPQIGQGRGFGEKREPAGSKASNPDLHRKQAASLFSRPSALILAPSAIYGKEQVASLIPRINRQLALDIGDWVDISLDLAKDRAALEGRNGSVPDQVVLLHEAWQPPIRGVLHYLEQMKSQVLGTRILWILLTRMPEEPDLSLDPGDPDVRVWKRAVDSLNLPGMIVERLSERIKDEG